MKRMINIDRDAIKKYCKETGITLQQFSQKIGRSNFFMYNLSKTGQIREEVYNLILKVFDLPRGTFEKSDNLMNADVKVSGYELSVDVRLGKLCTKMSYQGNVMYEAWAYIKGNTETDLMQAVSYAAHLMYKKAEETDIATVKKVTK